jgi:hypothetical protein
MKLKTKKSKVINFLLLDLRKKMNLIKKPDNLVVTVKF